MSDKMNSWDNEKIAEQYASLDFPGTYYLAYRDLPKIIQKHVKGSKVLDFGCGTGRSSRFLKQLGFDVVGVDISEHMLKRARECDTQGKYYLVKDCQYMHLGAERFDLIQSIFTFDNIFCNEKRLAIVNSLQKILKKNGKMIFLDAHSQLYTNEWASFSTSAFIAENKKAKSGDGVFVVMKDFPNKAAVKDAFWTEEDYLDMFSKTGLVCEKVYKPLGLDDEPFEWFSETKIPPWLIFVLHNKN